MKLVLFNQALLFLTLCYLSSAYRIVVVQDTSSNSDRDPLNGKVFLIRHGVARVIHHNETITQLGYTSDPGIKDCQQIGEKGIYSWRKYVARYGDTPKTQVCIESVDVGTVSALTRGPPVPPIRLVDGTLDSAMMIEMHRIDALQGQMIRDKIFIDFLTNPSVVIWNDHLVLATSLVWSIKEAPYFRPANRTPSETTEFGLLNITTITSSTAYVGPIRDRNPWAPSNLNAKKLRQVQPLDDEYSYMGLSKRVNRVDHVLGGQDPRMVPLDENHIAVAFTNRFKYRIRMGVAILSRNMTASARASNAARSSFDVIKSFPHGFLPKNQKSDEEFFHRWDNVLPYGGADDHSDGGTHNLVLSHVFKDLETGDTHKDEKNWTPFVHRDCDDEKEGSGSGNGNGSNHTRLLFIEQINPLVVVEPQWSSASPDGDVPVKQYSHSTIAYDLTWFPYGSLRGGTNAILIDDKYYLALYHSSSTIPGDGIFRSYFMGAFTFTKQKPFELMGVSAVPFMDKDLYQGAYAEVVRRHYDYVVFPMTLTRENKDTLLLSYGWQDRYGYLGRLDLQDVIDTLEPVRPGNEEVVVK